MKRVLLALAVVLGCAAGARAQISPGPLSRFHESLEGARNCRSCHAARGVEARLCLTCHTALGQRSAAGKGLHARPEYRTGCERCHVEHQGREFELVFWGQEGRAAFDHARTGFALHGPHAALKCESCHQVKHLQERAALAQGGVNLARTFLGLGTSCASCHADPHQGQFAPRGCTDCHDPGRWTPPARFDHGKTAFPLKGAHAAAACASCHTAQAPGVVRFKGTPHQGCASCHRDPHAGRLGPRCDSCHDPAAWTRIDPGRFDHSKARFALTGLHQKVACEGCHAKGKFQGLAFQTCASCHQDPHAGRLGGACATCHTTAGWQRVDAARFDHDRTAFPLKGEHAAVKCESCHRPGRPRRPLPHAACTDCHADRHAGQLAAREDRGRCESCHDETGFQPARFSPEDHAKTRWPLAGAHLAVPCDACHREVPLERLRALGIRSPAGAPSPTEQLRFASTACTECHRDPHGGQFARDGRTDCARCHDPTSWTEVRFDHDRDTPFPLQGAHRSVRCASCHLRATGAGSTMVFKGIGKACSDCHGAQSTGPVPPGVK